ncbi:hypothetical protein KBB89_02060 [Candidatus Gracilibacteria bacterium]|nr:hypothetical protein [Candidatus Gracilibacteria bacterium]
MHTPSSNREENDEENFLPRESFSTTSYNNFLLFFYRHMGAYRRNPNFLKFQNENPRLESELTALFSDQVGIGNPNYEQESRLYEAYRIMKGYGISDRELFD